MKYQLLCIGLAVGLFLCFVSWPNAQEPIATPPSQSAFDGLSERPIPRWPRRRSYYTERTPNSPSGLINPRGNGGYLRSGPVIKGTVLTEKSLTATERALQLQGTVEQLKARQQRMREEMQQLKSELAQREKELGVASRKLQSAHDQLATARQQIRQWRSDAKKMYDWVRVSEARQLEALQEATQLLADVIEKQPHVEVRESPTRTPAPAPTNREPEELPEPLKDAGKNIRDAKPKGDSGSGTIAPMSWNRKGYGRTKWQRSSHGQGRLSR